MVSSDVQARADVVADDTDDRAIGQTPPEVPVNTFWQCSACCSWSPTTSSSSLAIGVLPSNRKPSSAMAWLILILIIPFAGFIVFLFLGRTNVGAGGWPANARPTTRSAPRPTSCPSRRSPGRSTSAPWRL